MAFDEFWKRYPRKVGKKAADKAYQKAVKTIPHAAIMSSLELMLQSEWKHRRIEYIPHAATFLNRECFEERTEMREDDDAHPLGVHLCDVCSRAHEWMEDEPAYNMTQGYIFACPDARAKMRKLTEKFTGKKQLISR